jgi:hypothetical protein
MSEAAIERYLVKRAKEAGGEVRKVQWIGRRGAPDRVVFLPAEQTISGATFYRLPVWVELKAPGGIATFPKDARERAQQREHERMRACGQRVELVDSFEGVDALFA